MFASSHGLGSHGDLIKSLVDARILNVFEGAAEIQAGIVARVLID